MTAKQIQYRSMSEEDIPQVNALFAVMRGELHLCGPDDFLEAAAGEEITVAQSGGGIAGLISVWKPNRFIHFLMVSPDFRHRGIGRGLIHYAAGRFGYPLTLKCLCRNERARAFYSAGGWDEVGRGVSENGEYVDLILREKAAREAPSYRS